MVSMYFAVLQFQKNSSYFFRLLKKKTFYSNKKYSSKFILRRTFQEMKVILYLIIEMVTLLVAVDHKINAIYILLRQ